VILLLAVITAKCLNIAVAGYITGKVRYVLEHDVELKNIYAYAEALVSDVKRSIAKGGKNSDGDIRAESGGSLGKTAVLSAELVMPDMTGAYSGASGTDDVDNDADDGMRPGDSFPGEDSFPDHETAPDGPDGYEGSDDAAATDGGDVLQQYYEEDILQQYEMETRVLSASSGGGDDPAESAASGLEGSGDHGMIAPAEGRVVTPFGEIEGAAGMRKMHQGIDIAVEKISGVRAVLDGSVEETGSAPGYGKYIKIRHSYSFVTVYANCSAIIAGAGDQVKKGDVIAEAGGERAACGRHIHFEVWQDGVPADPLDYINIDFR
jgi:hypothetical protein